MPSEADLVRLELIAMRRNMVRWRILSAILFIAVVVMAGAASWVLFGTDLAVVEPARVPVIRNDPPKPIEAPTLLPVVKKEDVPAPKPKRLELALFASTRDAESWTLRLSSDLIEGDRRVAICSGFYEPMDPDDQPYKLPGKTNNAHIVLRRDGTAATEVLFSAIRSGINVDIPLRMRFGDASAVDVHLSAASDDDSAFISEYEVQGFLSSLRSVDRVYCRYWMKDGAAIETVFYTTGAGLLLQEE